MKTSKTITALYSALMLVFMLVSTVGCGPQVKTYKIGIVNLTSSLEPVVDGFKAGMTEIGYVEGENITYIYNGPVGANGIEAELQAMVNAKVDLIMALATPTAVAAKKIVEGTQIPVIFAPINDPIAAGLVNSLTEPGGNLTGIKVGGFVGKELEWLIKVAPRTRVIFAPYNPNDSSSALGLKELKDAAPQFGVQVVSPEVKSPDEIPGVLANIPENVDAIFMLTDAMLLSSISDFVAIANERKLPLASINEAQAKAGALLAFGPEFYPAGIQSARLADQILKGANPALLPVEQADFYLTVNQKAAKAIGIEFSEEILKAAKTIIR